MGRRRGRQDRSRRRKLAEVVHGMAEGQQGWHLVLRPGPLHRQEERRPATLNASAFRQDLLLVELRPTRAAVSTSIHLQQVQVSKSWKKKKKKI